MRRRVVLIALGVVAFVVFALTGVAFADDCSSPSDCANTAWTVGGAAAAVAVVIGAAIAGGWLPGEPRAADGGELSPECRAELESRLWRVHDALEAMAQLAVAREGALRMAASALADAQQLSPGVVEIAGRGGAGQQGEIVRDAAELVGDAGATTWEAFQASNQAVFREASKQLEEASRLAATTGVGAGLRDQAGQFADRAARAGRLAGRARWVGELGLMPGLDLVTTVLSQFTGRARIAELQEIGRRKAWFEQALEESGRWSDYAKELTAKVSAKRTAMDRAVVNYNTMAARCGAQPITASSIDELDQRLATAAAGAGSGAGSRGAVPASVLGRGPAPVEERPRDDAECASARGDYDRDIREFSRQRREWERLHDDFVKWERRWKDGHHSYRRYRQEWLDARGQLEREFESWAEAGTTATAVSAVSYGAGLFSLLSPPVAVGLGVAGFLYSTAQTLRTPDEWNILMASYLDERLNWILQRLGYATSESNRLKGFLEHHRHNLHTLGWRVRTAYARCGEANGWPAPPEDPDFTSMYQVYEGQLVSLEEMGTWR